MLFLLVNVGFTFLYAQVYNVIPLYLATVLERKPPVDLYTMANPLVIVVLPAPRHARLRQDGARPIDGRRHGIIGLGDGDQPRPSYMPGGPRARAPSGSPSARCSWSRPWPSSRSASCSRRRESSSTSARWRRRGRRGSSSATRTFRWRSDPGERPGRGAPVPRSHLPRREKDAGGAARARPRQRDARRWLAPMAIGLSRRPGCGSTTGG